MRLDTVRCTHNTLSLSAVRADGEDCGRRPVEDHAGDAGHADRRPLHARVCVTRRLRAHACDACMPVHALKPCIWGLHTPKEMTWRVPYDGLEICRRARTMALCVSEAGSSESCRVRVGKG